MENFNTPTHDQESGDSPNQRCLDFVSELSSKPSEYLDGKSLEFVRKFFSDMKFSEEKMIDAGSGEQLILFATDTGQIYELSCSTSAPTFHLEEMDSETQGYLREQRNRYLRNIYSITTGARAKIRLPDDEKIKL